jgi:CheY-like chemotaxis protein
VGNILIADDDKTCRDSIQRVLEREGWVVRAVGDVDGALEEVARLPFDLIFCDYRMPGKDGVDLLTQLRKLACDVPVLMISAYADSPTTETMLRLGAIGVLKKPIRRKELIDRAARAVRARSEADISGSPAGSRSMMEPPQESDGCTVCERTGPQKGESHEMPGSAGQRT